MRLIIGLAVVSSIRPFAQRTWAKSVLEPGCWRTASNLASKASHLGVWRVSLAGRPLDLGPDLRDVREVEVREVAGAFFVGGEVREDVEGRVDIMDPFEVVGGVVGLVNRDHSPVEGFCHG